MKFKGIATLLLGCVAIIVLRETLGPVLDEQFKKVLKYLNFYSP
jgi:hypothetical protein